MIKQTLREPGLYRITLLNGMSNRLDCLDYPRALALGLPIGSGMIESGHRHVLQARLKKARAAWWIESADRIANLRVLRANCQWENMWN